MNPVWIYGSGSHDPVRRALENERLPARWVELTYGLDGPVSNGAPSSTVLELLIRWSIPSDPT
jgi:hypothetical protein